ncbi:Os04g0494300 [Oryza sativa Japonica Group]|uniref:Os04g0494300 protein n=1 Tax=Oryza sativa subsp. japonica TaxID=39947 RepID=A0A0P0WBU9_ORYSJ|nr:hypothetical protein EE612_024155 [Oryza sativa]BAS89870.1 Os04g0494300 [Oryza sativa Japonica Group]
MASRGWMSHTRPVSLSSYRFLLFSPSPSPLLAPPLPFSPRLSLHLHRADERNLAVAQVGARRLLSFFSSSPLGSLSPSPRLSRASVAAQRWRRWRRREERRRPSGGALRRRGGGGGGGASPPPDLAGSGDPAGGEAGGGGGKATARRRRTGAEAKILCSCVFLCSSFVFMLCS